MNARIIREVERIGQSTVRRRLPDGLGAFTRHPAGRLGQPFYGWFTDADILFQAASAALFGEGRLKQPKDSIVAPLNQPKTAGLTALRACLVNEARH